MMSVDSRSRSRSPVGEGDNSPRNRRNDRYKSERSSRMGGGGSRGGRGNSGNRVYVSNIPFEYKWQDLKDLFRKEVGDVTFVEMFEDDNRRPRGSAVIEFDSVNLAEQALDKMHRFEVRGRKLVVKEKGDAIHSRDFQFLFNSNADRGDRRGGRAGRDRGGNMGGGGGYNDRNNFNMMNSNNPNVYGNTYGLSIDFLKSLNISGPIVNKVFVSNLDYKIKGDDVGEVFKVAGKVVSSEILKDTEGKSRGFAVIEFEHPVQAVQAISMLHNQTYYDRVINVRMDKVAEKQKIEGGNNSSSSSKLPPGLKSLGMGLGSNGLPITDLSSIETMTNQNTSNNTFPGPMPNNNMGGGMAANGVAGNLSGGRFDPISNLGASNNMAAAPLNPALAMLGNIRGLDQLGSMGGNLGMNMGGSSGNPVGMMGGGGNTGGGMGGGMGNAMGGNAGGMSSMQGGLNMMGGSNMGSNMGGTGNGAYPNTGGYQSTSNYMQSRIGNMMEGGASRGSNWNNPPSNDRGSSNSSYKSDLRTVVQVSNLPGDYTWQNLKDLCRNYGEIKFAEIKSKGLGLVRFASESEARRTSDMLDNQRFDGRILDASIL